MRRFATALVGAALLVAAATGALAQRPGASSAPTAEQAPSLTALSEAAQERERLKAQAERAKRRLDTLVREADRLASRQQTVLGEMRRLEIARERHAAEEAAARAATLVARAALDELSARIDAISAAAARRRPALRARLRRLYRIGPLDQPRHWLSRDTLVDTARAWRLLSAVAARDRLVLEQSARERAELEALRAAQLERVAETERLVRVADEARVAAARAVAAREALIARIDRERDLAARLAGELEEATARLSALLAPGAAASAAPPAAVLPLAPFRGDLDWPVNGQVAGRFGHRRQSRFGTVLPRNGVEIAAAPGSAVRAVHDGRVVFADEFAGFGRLVILEHVGGSFTLYGELGEVAVSRGAVVSRGTSLGTVGTTAAGASAVYFELRIDGKPVDPLEWLKPASALRSRL